LLLAKALEAIPPQLITSHPQLLGLTLPFRSARSANPASLPVKRGAVSAVDLAGDDRRKERGDRAVLAADVGPVSRIAKQRRTPMKGLILLFGATVAVGMSGSAFAQASGTPNAAFPMAAPHEIVWVNGVPCRTVRSGDQREIVACAEPGSTGTIATVPAPSVATGMATGVPASGTPASPFPTAAPHEIVYMNGVPCRTVLNNGEQRRIVACAQ
jgi:hypothetical protein